MQRQIFPFWGETWQLEPIIIEPSHKVTLVCGGRGSKGWKRGGGVGVVYYVQTDFSKHDLSSNV